MNATGRLLIEVKFSGFLIDWTPTKYEVKVNQQKDIFGKYDYCCERTQRGGSGFWDNINAYFYDMKYGLYNVKVKAHLKQGKNLKTASFSAEVVLGSDSAEYVMTISGSSVHIFKR